MRKIKTLKIDDREITVRELTVKQIMGLFDSAGQGDATTDDLAGILKDKLSLVSDLALEDVASMAPSELRQVWDAVKEVNTDFFDLARAVGLGQAVDKVLAQLKEALLSDFSSLFAASLKPGMGQPSGAMA